jgi:hypothetical protein
LRWEPWDTFNSDVYKFVTSSQMAAASERTNQAHTALNPGAFSKFFVELYEHNTTVDDTDTKRRWHQRVLADGMLKAVRNLCRRNKDNGEQIADTLKAMPNSVWFGRTEKLLRAVSHYVVLVPSPLIPGYDTDENMCVLGLYIGENKYEMSEGSSGLSFKMHETSKILGK